MGTTPALDFPYPESSDYVADGATAIQNLAEAVEDTLLGANYAGRYRNLLYNGEMRIAQRGTLATGVSTSGYFTVDRWGIAQSSIGAWTLQQSNDTGLTPSGFRSYLYVRNTTADAAPAASDYVHLFQRLEGQDLLHLRKGTAEALPLSLSFYVYTNKTGTYVAELEDYDTGRGVSASYTVPVANVWTKIEVTFPPDTTGMLNNDNGLSLALNFWLGAGSNYTSGTLQTSWATQVNANRAPGQVNLADSTANYFSITGVQLEVGPKPTPYEHLPIVEDFQRCLRYYYNSVPVSSYYNIFNAGNFASATMRFPVRMRATPGITFYDNLGAAGVISVANAGGGFQNGLVAPAFLAISVDGWRFDAGAAGGVLGNNGMLYLSRYEALAEL